MGDVGILYYASNFSHATAATLFCSNLKKKQFTKTYSSRKKTNYFVRCKKNMMQIHFFLEKAHIYSKLFTNFFSLYKVAAACNIC